MNEEIAFIDVIHQPFNFDTIRWFLWVPPLKKGLDFWISLKSIETCLCAGVGCHQEAAEDDLEGAEACLVINGKCKRDISLMLGDDWCQLLGNRFHDEDVYSLLKDDFEDRFNCSIKALQKRNVLQTNGDLP